MASNEKGILQFLDEAFTAYGDETDANRSFDRFREVMVETYEGDEAMFSLADGYVVLTETDTLGAFAQFRNGDCFEAKYCGFEAPACWRMTA